MAAVKEDVRKKAQASGLDPTDLFDIRSELTDEERMVQDSVARFVDDRALPLMPKAFEDGVFPMELVSEIADLGLLGCSLEGYGCAGLNGVSYGLICQELERGDSGLRSFVSVQSSLCMYPIHAFGSEEQKQRWLPPMIEGKDVSCFGVTEPNAGLDTTSLQVKAEKKGDAYIISGQKHWTSMAQRANKVLLLARTTSKDEVTRKTDGLSLFYTDLNRDHAEIREIEKMGRKAVDSNAVFYDNMPVPVEDLIGEVGKGFHYILHGLNPERILIAAEAVGLGRVALDRAVDYAKDREVFNRPIGMNQGIQHPLAKNWMELEAANLMVFNAATKYDAGEECGAEANAAKYLAAEAGYRACEQAVMTHGGMGYAKEYHVERYMREIMIPRIAPVSREMIFNFIGEKVLGLPRSF